MRLGQSPQMPSAYQAIESTLPPGQRALTEFPRFGIAEFAKRPLKSLDTRLEFSGALDSNVILTATDLAALPRTTLTQDFHCAAGWSYRGLQWRGILFKDVWEFVTMGANPALDVGYAVLRCQDGYRTSLPLSDLLAPNVLIADELNGAPLSIEHGAPMRLIAPAHYGYKSAKHLTGIELRKAGDPYRPLLPKLLEHPRARTALEERGQLLPGWILRYAFRPMIKPIIRKLKRITTRLPE